MRPEVAVVRAAIGKLRARLEELHRFHPNGVENRKDPVIETLSTGIDATLRDVFGADTAEYERFGAAKNLDRAPFLLNGTPMALVRNGLEQGKAVGISLLEEAIAFLAERSAEAATAAPAAQPATTAPASPAKEAAGAAAPIAPSILKPVAAAEPAPPAAAEAAAPGARDVIIVHGNDTVASGEIARFLRKAEFNAIILHQQGDEARTDIERLERHSGASFAVVLLPAEEEGAPKAGFRRPRARQAVTAELFYFVGKLGRAKVCVLTTTENEEPAVTGLSYAHYDPYEGWQKVVLKALEDAGFTVDWAKALR